MTQSKAFQRKACGPGRHVEVLDHPSSLAKCRMFSDYSRGFCLCSSPCSWNDGLQGSPFALAFLGRRALILSPTLFWSFSVLLWIYSDIEIRWMTFFFSPQTKCTKVLKTRGSSLSFVSSIFKLKPLRIKSHFFNMVWGTITARAQWLSLGLSIDTSLDKPCGRTTLRCQYVALSTLKPPATAQALSLDVFVMIE